MLLSKVIGVVVIARNGDRFSYYQDPKTYAGSITETTALGEADSFQLGSLLRSAYLDPASSTYIGDINFDLVDTKEVKTLIKTGVEGNVVFDSAIALLQGLYPPNPNNKIELANDTTVVAPLGGYQYVPVETVEPGNDRSLESWTDCPAFEKHTKEFYASQAFKDKERDAQPFFDAVRDYVFGRATKLQNAWNIYDFLNTQLVHNKTYAYRLPPTLINQARALANFHETGVFSDQQIAGIGNIAGRTLLHTILSSLERIAYNHDPLKFMLIQTTYQPFISFFQMTGITQEHPELQGIADYSSAIAIELRRGNYPEVRDFLRVKFRNGTSEHFRDLHVFGHGGDIPLTEFIYRTERSAITNNQQWHEVCSGASVAYYDPDPRFYAKTMEVSEHTRGAISGALGVVGLFALFVAVRHFVGSRSRSRAQQSVTLPGSGCRPEMVQSVVGDYGSFAGEKLRV